jgi:hypothetical protein
MAIECVREWRFRPGEYEGAPVPVAATLNVTFKLEKTLPVAGSERHVGTAFLEVEKADDH